MAGCLRPESLAKTPMISSLSRMMVPGSNSSAGNVTFPTFSGRRILVTEVGGTEVRDDLRREGTTVLQEQEPDRDIYGCHETGLGKSCGEDGYGFKKAAATHSM